MIIIKAEEDDTIPKETSFEELRLKLRQDLDERFSDVLISQIVSDFYDNEILRLKSSEYKVTCISPINIEYSTTLRDLNSHMVLLTRRSNISPIEHSKKVSRLINDYEEALDTMMPYPSPFYLYHGNPQDKNGKPINIEVKHTNPFTRDVHNQPPYFLQVTSNIDGSIKNYAGPWPEKYLFYYTALICLLKSFLRKDLKKEVKRGKVDLLGLNIADYATIMFYATAAGDFSTANVESERARFIKKHELDIDPVNFNSAMSDIQKLKRRRAKGRLKSIKGFLEQHYPNAVERMLEELSPPF